MFKIFRRKKPNKSESVTRETPPETLQRVSAMINNGAKPILENLSREEMAAAGTLINQGKAQIDQVNCRAFLSAKLKD